MHKRRTDRGKNPESPPAPFVRALTKQEVLPNGHSRGGGDQLVLEQTVSSSSRRSRPRADGLVPPRVSSVHAQLAPWVNSCLGSSERRERESGLVQLPLGGGGRGRLQGYHSLGRLDAARETGQGMDF